MLELFLMKLIVYTKTSCPWCIDVVDFLNDQDIAFEERNVTNSAEYMQEMLDKSGQSKAPTLDLDGDILADAGKEEVEEFLKEKEII